MCLIIDYDKHRDRYKPLIADRDILVWKIIYDTNVSLYRGFQYIANTQYCTEELKVQFEHSIHAGYHAYTTRETTRARVRTFRKVLQKGVKIKIVKFTIPKGAKYYIGNNLDIVSNTIISGDLKHCR